MTSQKSKQTTELEADGALCRLVQTWLPGYLHSELTAVQQRQLQAHLAQCNSCAQRVQEARLLDADLQAEANRYQPRLSQNMSLHIQKRVYRRMQRSLMWQRTTRFVQISTAVAALVVLLAGSFLFSRFWLSFLANPPTETPVAGEELNLPAVPQPVATVEVQLPNADLEIENGRLDLRDTQTSLTPGQTPEQLAATLVTTALAKDARSLNGLFVRTGMAQESSVRIWLLFSKRCQWSLDSATDLQFTRRQSQLSNLATILIWYDGKRVGEIKMRRFSDNWFITFTQPPAINQCLLDQYKNRS
ncbi:hypothetical protein MNBD_CHLOROFLEXI01-3657 [hydrothermal vent metagenome]|uniref:Putative zinc-finger domain-containing protein n=1 Tax=hydrothermal vent metagenome TaxID=652676 RepID=A0A3B0US82_9ZZZZ